MKLDLDVVFEDEVILAVNKPAGVVVNRAESVPGPTVQDWAEDHIVMKEPLSASNPLDNIFIQRSGVAHRLDKDTSGILLLGKTPSALASLMKQFKEREIHKQYIALVHGEISPKEGFWRLPLARGSKNRFAYAVDPMGKMAETSYQVLETYQYRRMLYSLVKLFPKTGRTHQLRVHLKHMKHPIVADAVYLNRKQYQLDLEWCPRHFLHAQSIHFFHPNTRAVVELEAPLSADLQHAYDVVSKG